MPEDKDKKRYNEETAARICKSFGKLQTDRGNWDSHWREIAERIWPSHHPLFNEGYLNGATGDKRTEFLFDSTPTIALNRFASIVDSLLTPRNQTWHRLGTSDQYLAKDRETRLWFDEVNQILFKYRYAPPSNFASQNNLNYKMLGAYGSGCVFVDDYINLARKKDGIRYRTIHLSGVYFRENHQGIVDTVYRKYQLTARQAMQEWGDACPEQIRDAAENAPDRLFTFIHCVEPRTDYDAERVDYKGMPFASFYVSLDCKQLLDEGGYRVMPYTVSRYEQVPGEVYGRSPAMDVLPAIKTLNEEKKTVLKQGHRAVDPILLVHDDGIADAFSLRPGALNVGGVSADGRPLVSALQTGRVDIGKELMDDERSVINDAFLVTLFQILVETPQMTATEVMERTREKGILLAPTIGRQQSEYLGPLIDRELDLLIAQGVLPPFPQALIEAQGEYRIEYESPLSRAARAEEAAGAMRAIEMAIQVSTQTQNPAPLDHFDWDVITPETSDIQGMPARWRNSPEKIQQIREGRAQQEQEQTQIQAAPGAAAMVKSVAVARESKS